jgi:hypothetical protein
MAGSSAGLLQSGSPLFSRKGGSFETARREGGGIALQLCPEASAGVLRKVHTQNPTPRHMEAAVPSRRRGHQAPMEPKSLQPSRFLNQV